MSEPIDFIHPEHPWDYEGYEGQKVDDSQSAVKYHPLSYRGSPQWFGRCCVAGNFCWVSGCSGRIEATGDVSKDDVKQQTRDAWDKIKKALKVTGTSLENIMHIWILSTDAKEPKAIKEAYMVWLKENSPYLYGHPPLLHVLTGCRPRFFINADRASSGSICFSQVVGNNRPSYI